MNIEPFDVAAASESELAALYDVSVELEREFLPDDPPEPSEEFVADIRSVPAYRTQERWVARDDGGRIIATGQAGVNDVEDNRHICDFWLGVRADARRRGLGRALLAEVVEFADGQGRTLLETWAEMDAAADPFLTRAGAERRYVERRSRLIAGDVDEALMKDWVDRASERAADYSLVGWDGPCPEEHIEAWAAALHVMNTAPMEDLDFEDEVITPDRVRANEKALQDSGATVWVLVARHDPTGTFAGLTELYFPSHRDWIAYQGNTGVDPDHRNQGLGRWLKAAMFLRARSERPALKWIDTWNAGTNEPMLNINVAMGFRPLRYVGGWQVPVETAAAYSGR